MLLLLSETLYTCSIGGFREGCGGRSCSVVLRRGLLEVGIVVSGWRLLRGRSLPWRLRHRGGVRARNGGGETATSGISAASGRGGRQRGDICVRAVRLRRRLLLRAARTAGGTGGGGLLRVVLRRACSPLALGPVHAILIQNVRRPCVL